MGTGRLLWMEFQALRLLVGYDPVEPQLQARGRLGVRTIHGSRGMNGFVGNNISRFLGKVRSMVATEAHRNLHDSVPHFSCPH